MEIAKKEVIEKDVDVMEKENVIDDENADKQKDYNRLFPLVPLRGMLVFPGMIVNLDVGRDRSIKAVETAMEDDREIMLVTQKKAATMDPVGDDLYRFGTIAKIKQLLKLPNGAIRILVEGISRAKVLELQDDKVGMFEANIEVVEDIVGDATEIEALKRMLIETFEQWVLP